MTDELPPPASGTPPPGSPSGPWPAPPTAAFAQRHEQKRVAMLAALARAADFSQAELEVLHAVLASMNREIARAFAAWIEAPLRAQAALDDDSRQKFLDAWMTAADVAQALIGNIKPGANEAIQRARFIPHAQMDLENTCRHLAFYERYQRNTAEDQEVRALMDKRRGPTS